jgi:hypothetical protein
MMADREKDRGKIDENDLMRQFSLRSDLSGLESQESFGRSRSPVLSPISGGGEERNRERDRDKELEKERERERGIALCEALSGPLSAIQRLEQEMGGGLGKVIIGGVGGQTPVMGAAFGQTGGTKVGHASVGKSLDSLVGTRKGSRMGFPKGMALSQPRYQQLLSQRLSQSPQPDRFLDIGKRKMSKNVRIEDVISLEEMRRFWLKVIKVSTIHMIITTSLFRRMKERKELRRQGRASWMLLRACLRFRGRRFSALQRKMNKLHKNALVLLRNVVSKRRIFPIIMH